MYAVIRRYEEADRGRMAEIAQLSREQVVPIVSRMRGFVAHYLLDAGDGVVASVSLFEDRAAAEESSRQVVDLVKQSYASLLPNPPQVTMGDVLVQETR